MNPRLKRLKTRAALAVGLGFPLTASGAHAQFRMNVEPGSAGVSIDAATLVSPTTLPSIPALVGTPSGIGRAAAAAAPIAFAPLAAAVGPTAAAAEISPAGPLHRVVAARAAASSGAEPQEPGVETSVAEPALGQLRAAVPVSDSDAGGEVRPVLDFDGKSASSAEEPSVGNLPAGIAAKMDAVRAYFAQKGIHVTDIRYNEAGEDPGLGGMDLPTYRPESLTVAFPTLQAAREWNGRLFRSKSVAGIEVAATSAETGATATGRKVSVASAASALAARPLPPGIAAKIDAARAYFARKGISVTDIGYARPLTYYGNRYAGVIPERLVVTFSDAGAAKAWKRRFFQSVAGIRIVAVAPRVEVAMPRPVRIPPGR